MKNRRRILLALLFSATLGGLALLLARPRDPLFHAKPESFWITNIVYNGSDEQTKQWRDFGPDGVRLLARTLDKGNGLSRTYRNAYRQFGHKLPSVLAGSLPKPTDPVETRMKALSLLIRLRPDSKLAEPSIARAMKDDHPFVRQLAVGWYETGLPVMTAEERKARLPDFLRLVQDDNHWVRNNAATALSFCGDEAPTVAPVLAKVLQERDPQIQITIARALVHVDPHAAVQAGVVPAAIRILKNPDGQIAYRAAELLGELQAEAALSVPALIEGLDAPDREVAIAAFRALTKFKEQADVIVPALKKATQRNDIPAWVKSELAQIDPDAGKTGVKQP